MSTHWSDGTTAITAVLSTITAGIALFAADKANKTANTVARIERERWHADLTPDFEITLREESHGHGRLHMYLAGPNPLRSLDEITIRVDDDDNDHTLRHPHVGGPTQEQIDAHVWGPWRFLPSSDGAGQDGRTVRPAVSLNVGRGHPFSMERTHHGFWMTGMTDETWQRQYVDQPIRLIITCRRGDEEWVVARRVENPWLPPA
jgi:hypothetical protein